MSRRWLGPGLLLALACACRCGDEPTAAGDWKALFDTLIKGLPEAATDAPLEALPGDVAWIAASPDPEAWRAWAASTPTGQAWMATPLFEDVVTSRTYVALDGMRRSVARASALTGDAEDAQAMWRGPTAIAVDDPGAPDPKFVVVKRIDPSLRAVVRMAAAFAQLEGTTTTEVEKIAVRSVAVSGRTFSFALFRNLMIAGNDATLVERAARLAQKKGDDVPASKDALLPAAATPGIHARVLLSRTPLGELSPFPALGVSLRADARAPVVLRRDGAHPAAPALLALLAYAPASTTAAWIDGAPPSALYLAALTRVADNLGEPEAEPGKKRKKKLAPFDAEALAGALQPGTALFLGVRDDATDQGALGPVVVLRHGGAPGVEPHARGLVERLTGEVSERTVLEDQTVLFGRPEVDGVTAAVTRDALVIGLGEDAVRRAVAAGAGRAPSIGDRKGIDRTVATSGGLYLDGPKAAAWLGAFYRDALGNDPAVSAQDLEHVLGPTFAALGRTPVMFGKMTADGEIAEGALEVLP